MKNMPETKVLIPSSIKDDDMYYQYVLEVERDPYNVKSWWQFLVLLSGSSSEKTEKTWACYDCALSFLPRSYKLWMAYLTQQRMAYKNNTSVAPVHSMHYNKLIHDYEKALIHLNKMPKLWEKYVQLLCDLRYTTKTRHVFDRSLRALPLTQHHRIWVLYLKFVKKLKVSATAVRVYRRYLMYEPNGREDYVDYLLSIQEYSESAIQLCLILQDQNFVSLKGKTTYDLWMQLCDLLTQYDIRDDINVELILRHGLSLFSDEIGRLWCCLASYYIRLGNFSKTRDIYVEAIATVETVRDFTTIFDAYVQFLEGIVTYQMSTMEGGTIKENNYAGNEMNRWLLIYENAANQRPFLLNSVLLRQNPNNVREWSKRITLYSNNISVGKEKDDEQEARNLMSVIQTYTQALQTINPKKVPRHKLSQLWLNFAKVYEKNDPELTDARIILQRALNDYDFFYVDDIADVILGYAEMELRHDNYDEALVLLRSYTVENANGSSKKEIKLRENLKIWEMYLDLEESLGDSFEATKRAYEMTLEIGIMTVEFLLNYTSYLKEHKYFELAFNVYERGLALFNNQWPYAGRIYEAYVDDFTNRYKDTKLERTRDLFEQILVSCPIEHAYNFYVKYSNFEKEFGMSTNSCDVLAKAISLKPVPALPSPQRYNMLLTYIDTAKELYGVNKVRKIMEQALEDLEDMYMPDLCLKFANLETKLGEIDRARSLYSHGSQFVDPNKPAAALSKNIIEDKLQKSERKYWSKWQEFEVTYGNEGTFLEMLRIKRSVATQYSQVNYGAAEMVSMETTTKSDAEVTKLNSSAVPFDGAMAQLEHEQKDTSSSLGNLKRKQDEGSEQKDSEQQSKKSRTEVLDDAEIDIDMDDDDDDNEEVTGNNGEIQEKKVPDAVFGSMKD